VGKLAGVSAMSDDLVTQLAIDADIDWEAVAASNSLNPFLSDFLASVLPEQREIEFGRMALTTLRYARRSPLGKDDFQLFLAAALSQAPRSKGQLFQDLWAWWENDRRTDGYFVEFGAANGVYLSNTYFLEKQMGWTGILAEPHPDFQASLRENRACFISSNCVFSHSGESVPFRAAVNGEYSRMEDIKPEDSHEASGARDNARIVAVETITLDDLLDEAGAPDEIGYLSVDTEGSEYEILRAFNFDRRNIRCISVEHNYTPAREQLHALLTANGYRRKWEYFTAFDDWYVRA
jgi:FkbM family methyltransferase